MKIMKHCGCRWPDFEIKNGEVICSYCGEPAEIVITMRDDYNNDEEMYWSDDEEG